MHASNEINKFVRCYWKYTTLSTIIIYIIYIYLQNNIRNKFIIFLNRK